MFDIGFSELVLIAIIALVVIGPKRLPETMRFAGLWLGRVKRAMARAYKELDQELGLDEVRRQLHNEEVLRNIEEHKRKLEADIRSGMGSEANNPAQTGATDSAMTTALKPDVAEPLKTTADNTPPDTATTHKADKTDG